jgi:hypothetical protein
MVLAWITQMLSVKFSETRSMEAEMGARKSAYHMTISQVHRESKNSRDWKADQNDGR